MGRTKAKLRRCFALTESRRARHTNAARFGQSPASKTFDVPKDGLHVRPGKDNPIRIHERSEETG